MRSVRLVVWFLVGLLLGGVGTYSYAESIAATGGQTVAMVPLYRITYPGMTTGLTAQETCDAFCAKSPLRSACFANSVNLIEHTWACNFTYDGVPGNQYGGDIANACPPGSSLQGSACVTGLSCPAGQNWTLSGSTCSRPDCAALGEMRDPATGMCVSSCPPAGAFGTGAAAPGSQTLGQGGAPPSTLCLGACAYRSRSFVSAGDVWAVTTGASMGVACNPNSPASNGSNAAACVAKGQGYGTVNGVVVCSGPQGTPSQPVVKGTTTTSATTSPTGATGTTDTTSTTSCNGSDCTTTTSSTNSGGGSSGGTGGAGGTIGNAPNGTTTTSTTAPVGKGDPTAPGGSSFCAENPSSPLCVQSTTFTGSCGAPPVCTGDAVQCAQATAAYNLNCSLSTAPTTAVPDIPTSDDAMSSIVPVDVGGGVGSCPGDITLPHGASLSWQYSCDMAIMLRPLIIALAWLAAAFIVMGGTGKKE